MKDLSEITILDILSFYIGLKNFDLNLSQTDLQKQTQEIDAKVDQKIHKALDEIHKHLETQDQKIDYIIKLLGEKKE